MKDAEGVLKRGRVPATPRERRALTHTSAPVDASRSAQMAAGRCTIDRRRALVGVVAAAWVGCPGVAAAAQPAPADAEPVGDFEMVRGRPGVVIGVPHGTADAGTLDIGRVLRERLGAGAVFVTGFWDRTSRRRINVNRPSEQIIGPESQVLREWQSDPAIAANRRYADLVKEAAQGPVRLFVEIHSNHKPEFAASIEASTLGVSLGEARKLKAAFQAAQERLAADVPRLAIHVSPADRVAYPNYRNASSVSSFSQRGCAIEHPGQVLGNRAWRLAYAACLADAMVEARWDTSR
jgi:hypothetical protein